MKHEKSGTSQKKLIHSGDFAARARGWAGKRNARKPLSATAFPLSQYF
jgi:hypothetical protein